MKRFFILFSLILMTFASQAGFRHSERSVDFADASFRHSERSEESGSDIDVLHYEIHLNNIDFTAKSLTAVTTVTLVATDNISSFDLDLKALTVSSVTSNEVVVADFSQSGDFLTINLSESMTIGEMASFEISYSGVPFHENWGGFHWSGEYAYNLGVGFDSQPHNLGKTWFPCVDDFVDKATYDLYVTVPNAKTAICGGAFVGTTDNGDGTSTWHWTVSQEIATYLISVTIGEYTLWEETYTGINGEVPVNVYVRPSQINNVAGSFVNIKEITHFFEECFGAYPFNRIGFVSTGLGCMEHVDNIAYSSGLINGNTTNEYYIAHELSHMWFGNKVTCATAGDMWLNEGFGTFCGNYYKKDLYGYDSYKEEMDKLISDILSSCHLTEGFIPLNNMPLDLTYGTTVYDKGATVVHTMMNYLGEEKFFVAMRYYMNEYAYYSATSENLRDAITQSTGVDMTGFFDTWVFTAGNPHYTVDSFNVVPNGSQYDVHVFMSQQHRGAEHIGDGVIYELAFMDEDWNLVTDTVCWDGVTGHSVKTLDFSPIMVVGDYYNKTADARIEENYVIKTTGSNNFSKANFKLITEEISDSSFVRVEHHWVGPSPLNPPVFALTLSTDRYWSVFREDKGNALINGEFQYTNTVTFDQNLIHSENDSTVLLYRANAGEPWQSIPYEFQGIWKFGKMTVENLQSGDYCLAAYDKNLLSQNELSAEAKMTVVYPNPSSKQVTVKWNDVSDGALIIKDINSKTVRTISFHDNNSLTFSVEELTSGAYYINRCNISGEIVSTNKLIIK